MLEASVLKPPPAANPGEWPTEQLRAYYTSTEAASVRRRELRAWRVVEQLATQANDMADPTRRSELLADIREVVKAVEQARVPPVPERIEVGWSLFSFWQHAINRVGRGTSAAANLTPASSADSSRQPPLPSTYWQPPARLHSLDLYAGYGRAEPPDHDDVIWNYHAPKTGAGAHPGFTVRVGTRELKVKFAEVHSEAFAARIFAALGYHVPEVDHAPRLRVRYDRRLLREFHQRADLQSQLRLFGVLPLYRIRYQVRFDPFDSLAAAVLRDGRVLTAAELRRRLFPTAWQQAHPEDRPENFDPAFEREIDHLVTQPANVEPEAAPGRAVGAWSFAGPDQVARRELRGLALLAAWVCWFDSRPVNTRLRVHEMTDGSLELRHHLTDLGGCLGKSRGFMLATVGRPNDFAWSFTRPRRVQGPGRMTIPFRITGFQPIAETPAFREMTRDDARWMARWIGQLTEAQIVAALIAAGFDSATTRLYAEKLIARRDQMIRDLELTDEIPLLRGRQTDRGFDYDPAVEDAATALRPDGRRVTAPLGDSVVREGKLESR